MRKFKKYFNRSMPLWSVEYWYQGEYYGLPKITEDLMYFNPFFVYKKRKGVDVYYDIKDPKGDDELLVSYFEKNPNKFDLLMKEYEQESKEMLKLSEKADPKDFSKIFNLHILTWPKLTAMISLAEYGGQTKLAKKAYNFRKKTQDVEYLYFDNVVKSINQLLPNTKDFTEFLTSKEIINRNIPNKNELNKRKNKYIYFEGKLYTDLSIKDLKKLKKIEIDEKILKITTIQGNIAFPGKIKGRVKVIKSIKEINKIEKGDILVASMTTPDMMIAIHKATAIITDEGGITCHAAIVSRELKIPCIIGTGNATKALKDGDLVEVDANKGVVKVLKKK